MTRGSVPLSSTFRLSGKRTEIGELEQLLHQDDRIDRAGAWFEDETDIVGAFVAHVLEQRQALGQQQFGVFSTSRDFCTP